MNHARMRELDAQFDKETIYKVKTVLEKSFKEEKIQICYKTNKPCEHNCSGLCKESC